MIAFWAFFSIFPLMLVFVTVLGYVLPSGTKTSVLHDVGTIVPVLKGQKFEALNGAWWPLLVGITRVYRDRHWLSDILGGWAAGVTVAAASSLIYGSLSRREDG